MCFCVRVFFHLCLRLHFHFIFVYDSRILTSYKDESFFRFYRVNESTDTLIISNFNINQCVFNVPKVNFFFFFSGPNSGMFRKTSHFIKGLKCLEYSEV